MTTTTTFPAFADPTVPFVAPAPSSLGELTDDAVIDLQRTLGELRRRVDAVSSVVAGELARRSRHDLGFEGLAQRLGARTPETLVAQVTGSSPRDAAALVRVGTLVADLDPGVGTSRAPGAAGAAGDPGAEVRRFEHLAPVSRAVAEARLSIGAADTIRLTLGAPNDRVSSESLTSAAATLVDAASSLSLDQLAARARELRAELDDTTVREHERELRSRRYLRLTPQPDGMTRIHGLLDPESAAIVVASVDAATSPRRGGPRFVDSGARGRAEAERVARLTRDARDTSQIALDSLVELIRIGTVADDGTVLGARTPAVRVLVTDADLARRRGAGHLEGQSSPVSIPAVERRICADGTVPIHFDSDGQVINVGRDQRLFTARQRIGLAARDGGCRFPGCERPPTWCEAHHIIPWHRERGRTDLADGVLLCRHHHLLVHDNGWRITRDGANYSAIPPRTLDPAQRPIPMPSRSATARRLAG
ncbi:HNH endonuclease signature motif containing protein [uncultured Schumannella sp.]|uniref:HNH endonuclease signature motif containing protein n=1 Tax=uncultured Schumannella sp. TaxID=1195956 RepID=UPI0025F0E8DD|nr:HNH endonuclease signature motif containing protein [uncultured Schumannella sp.]